jgi:nucleoside 2-deoxyribosyltransferase
MIPTVYLCGPIGGLTFREANTWRQIAKYNLEPQMKVLNPLRDMEGTGLKCYGDPLNGDGEGIAPFDDRFLRDYADVMGCDAVLANFHGARRKSIGSAVELGWAFQRGIHVVTVMPKGNINEDIFLERCMGIRVDTLFEGVEWIHKAFGKPMPAFMNSEHA